MHLLRLFLPSLLVLFARVAATTPTDAEMPALAPHTSTHVLGNRGLVHSIWEKLKSAATCDACEDILVLVKTLALMGDGPFVDVLQTLCKLSGQDKVVCDGSFGLEGPIIANVFREMDLSSSSPKSFCATFLGLCDYPSVTPWVVPLPSQKIPKIRPKSRGRDPIKVVHFSDIHIDPLYAAGANDNCNKLICCRATDNPKRGGSNAGPNGDHKWDSPLSLEASLYTAISQIVPDAAFSIFTGDIVDHAIWNTSVEYNKNSIVKAYESMSQALGLVYGTAGNHEMHPTNAYQPNNVGDRTGWIYDLLSNQWSQWIGQAPATDAKHIGAFSTKYPSGNLRIISLNTNLYERHNFWMYRNLEERDPNSQIAWLVTELDAAEKAGENVYIVGHMPFGEKDCLRNWSNYLHQVVERYSSTISAMFFGHTHVDHFEVSYSQTLDKSASDAFMVSYIAPSLTPTSGMPSFRVYDVDPDTFGILDVTTYIADMRNAAFQSTGPVWTKYYSAKESYGMAGALGPEAELTPAFWHNVTEAFETKSELFDAYIARKSRGWKVGQCDTECKTKEICQIRAGRSQDNCFKPTPGFHLRKRSEIEARGEHDECGVPISSKVFHALTMDLELLKAFYSLVQEKAGFQGGN